MEDKFEKLFEKRLAYTRYDLAKVKEVYKALNFDETLGASILVAGTNGKGTTSGFLAKLFEASGYKVGLFTSPHLCHFRERIQCSHINVTDNLLSEELENLKVRLGEKDYETLSFFEVSTLLSFHIFSKYKTQINIIEVGLGGLLDATNVIEPCASLIVSIGFDHQGILGQSLEDIFLQKLGVSRKNKPLFLGMDLKKRISLGIEGVLQREKSEKGFIYYEPHLDFSLEANQVKLKLFSNEEKVFPILPKILNYSPVLRENYSLAFSVYAWFLSKQKKNIDFTALSTLYEKSSFYPFSLRARFEEFHLKLKNGSVQKVLLDVCHNKESLYETYRSLSSQGILSKYKKIPVFLSILNDKPVSFMLDYIQRFANPLVLFSCSNKRSFSRDSLKEQTHSELPFFDSFYDVWESSYGKETTEAPWLICGSFFAVGEVLHFLQELNT